MKILYIDSCIISVDEYKHYIDNLHNFNKIGRGTYCFTYKITKDLVIKHYPFSQNYDEEIDDYIPEIKSEIKFIKKYNNLPYVANTFIISIVDNDIYILQEYLIIPNVVNSNINNFKNNLNYFLELIKINTDLLQYNYINFDIKHTNIGYDSKNNLKIFDFNLFFEINDNTKYINLYRKFDYYYLHPPINFTIKNIISYSIAILILESFSTNSQCKEFLYEPQKLNYSKFVLLKLKESLLTPKLYKILHLCLTDKYSPEYFYNELKSLFYNIETQL